MEDQFKLTEKIQQKANVNIVSCGDCGSVFLHTRSRKNAKVVPDLTCPHCKRTSDPSDFPDLYYEDWEKDSLETQDTLGHSKSYMEDLKNSPNY